MRKPASIVLLGASLIWLHLGSATGKSGVPGQEKSEELLGKILARCADYYQFLREIRLTLLCRETVQEEIFGFRKGQGRIFSQADPNRHLRNEKNSYISEYQLTLTQGKIEEQRVLLAKNGLAINQAVENLGTRTYKNRIPFLEPLGILDQDGQGSFDFRIVKQGHWNGIKVAILKAIPRDDEKRDYFSAEAWIALHDLSLLRLELSQRFLGDWDGIEKTSEGQEVEPRIKISLEFLFMKDGIRFPTSCTIEESYVEPKRNKFLRSMTTVTCEKHRVQVD
jgi:hypothetical protein